VPPFLVYNAAMHSSVVLSAFVALVAGFAAAHISSAADTTAPATAAKPAIEFVMPAPGAFIPAGTVVAAGRLPEDAGFVNLLLDGAPVATTTRSGRTFWASLTPGPGAHTLEARAGDLEASLRFTFGSGGRGLAPYRYHVPVLEGRCAECHAGVRRPATNAESETCKSCHRKLATIYPYVHGPLAAGKCVVCHEPHGSSWPALTVADARAMCVSCHDQPGSTEHVAKSRSRVCYLCHNPHASMNKKFLYDIVK
jgi:predicted CXXCH cytochrome family protein